ncbi:MAG: NFACT family protein [Acidobacteriota bacterium]|nr:NFACT family protein [Acidobacteriota bacterium]
MDNETLQAVVDEILPILVGKRIGKIFQLGSNQLAIDFRPGDGRYLFLNFEPSLIPRLYLIRRRVRELEKESEQSGNFLLFARKRLSDGQLTSISKDAEDRIVRFDFLVEDENVETVQKFKLVAQLTGKAANLFLLGAENRILERLRETHGEGQETGQIYQQPQFEVRFQPPIKTSLLETVSEIELKPSDFPLFPPSPLSERLDTYFSKIEKEREFDSAARAASARLRQGVAKKEKLLQRLEQDLRAHGEPEMLKRRGDLLLANLYTAQRAGNRVVVIDYFDENAPEIEIEADENLSLQQAAEKYFARYSKARNAAQELTARIEHLKSETESMKFQISDLEIIIVGRDETALGEFIEKNKLTSSKQAPKNEKPKSKKEPEIGSGVRRYRSSDGLEILVGRAAKDNDYLTFRVAKSLDWWMHAADYPGSHVVVRNPSKGELPTKTLIEAAELAAKFSQAREDTKVAVNYTQRKFVSKPKQAAPGLVRLSSFRTILVEPKESGERILN